MKLALIFAKVDPARGGAETYIIDLCRHLVACGHEVDLYAESWRRGVLPAQVRCVQVPVTGRTRVGRVWSFARSAESALSKAHYDCTIGFINTWHHDVIIPQGGIQRASLRANARRFPMLWQRALYRLAKWTNPKTWLVHIIERKQYSPARSARVVAVSAMVHTHIEQTYHVPERRISTIPNAIEADRLGVSQPGAVRCGFRNGLGLEPHDLVGLFVGHNYALKGLKPLLHALGERKRRDPSARRIHLLVCGGGRVAPYRRLAHRLGLSDAVHMMGYQRDIRPCFWSSDFFVLPTYYDPCSLVVFEALACGLPVITTSCNGAGELIRDGQEGFVIQEPDAREDLILTLDRMADDALRIKMSSAAARLGQEQSFENHVTRLTELFAEVATAKARRGQHTPHAKGKALESVHGKSANEPRKERP
jgi:UDP-glucose:(heptosyl)LPS alpha-1,3-glucosyltransferase